MRKLLLICLFSSAALCPQAVHAGLNSWANDCYAWISKLVGRSPSSLTRYTFDVTTQAKRRGKGSVTAKVAALPWKKHIGLWVEITYLSDGGLKESVEQAVHSSATLENKNPGVPALAERVRLESKRLAKEEAQRLRALGEEVDEGSLRPEVGLYVVMLGGKPIYTSGPFTSGHRASISLEVSDAEWAKMADATREKLRLGLSGIPEVFFIHTHPTAFSPLSPPDISHIDALGRFFRDTVETPSKVTAVASPVPNEGEFLFVASVRH